MANDKNYIIAVEPISPTTEEVLKLLTARGTEEIIRCPASANATRIVEQLKPCLLLCSISAANNISPVVELLKRNSALIKNRKLKTVIISKINNPQLRQIMSAISVSEFIEEPLPSRTILFKVNLQIKALETVKRQEALKKTMLEKLVQERAEQMAKQKANPQKRVERPNYMYLHSEEKALRENLFIFKRESVKRVEKKIHYEMSGPDPSTGEWIESEAVDTSPDKKTQSWLWVPKDANQAEAVSNKTGWVHEGEKPVYNLENKNWDFSSEAPSLSYFKNKRKIKKRITQNEIGEVESHEDVEEKESVTEPIDLNESKKLGEKGVNLDLNAKAKAKSSFDLDVEKEKNPPSSDAQESTPTEKNEGIKNLEDYLELGDVSGIALENVAPITTMPQKKTPSLAGINPMHLHIFVMLTDALNFNRPLSEVVPKLLVKMASTIGKCKVSILSADSTAKTNTPTEFYCTISVGADSKKKILGYLQVVAAEQRLAFKKDEMSCFLQAAELLGALMEKSEQTEGKKAA